MFNIFLKLKETIYLRPVKYIISKDLKNKKISSKFIKEIYKKYIFFVEN